MITLDYTTYNPRWKHSGIRYSSWEAFAFALGYLANRLHYRNINDSGLIELHFESNDNQGAWGKEGRIHYYGERAYLSSEFLDWYNAKSAGVNNITYRINSKHYGMDIVFVLKQVRGQERLIRLIESLNGYKKICGLNIVEKSKM